MNTASPYSSAEPAPAQVAAMPGHTVIEFGSNDCGICRSAQGLIAEALQALPPDAALNHLKIEDGPGRPLGRSFRIKLWPTLVMLRQGQEVARVVRPRRASEVADALAQLREAPPA
jgi:thioredoxin 1